ncbi:MAG: hypothetical protein C4B58_00055 [Deltaproteobacteria bacterium]|nr:MAG: hypothetical protein C4B58_00055 [Deltaproteobacteria bacterium]
MFKPLFNILTFSALFSLAFFGLASYAVSQEVKAWTNLGLYGGQIYDIAINPSNPDKMFAGTYMGDGLYVTSDGGRNWQAVDDTFKDHAVLAVKIAPSNNNVIWVAYNYWVEKSTDEGKTWTHISIRDMQWNCQNCGGVGDGNRFCISLAIDPSDPQTVYVGTAGPDEGYFGSSGATYKTMDGGTTWTKTNQGNDFDYTVVDIDIDPQNSSIIWAVTSSYGVGGWAGTLYRSEDRGETWNNILTRDSEFTTVVVKPNDSNTVFTGSGYGIIKHYFDGNEWQHIWPVIPEDIACRLVWDIAFDPRNPAVLYAAWKNIWFGDGLPKVSRSVNGGIDWETYTVDYNFISLAVHPTKSGVIFGGEEYLGVYESEDHGQAWSPVNNGISAVIVYDVALDPDDSAHILAGTISGVYEKKPGEAWSRLLQYGTDSLRFHPTESLTFYAGIRGQLAKTTDGGLTWSYSNDLGWRAVNNIEIDPSDTNIIYIAASRGSDYGRIYKSEDSGVSFSEVLVAKNKFGKTYDFNVVTLDPSDPQHIYAGGGKFYAPRVVGDLWESRDGGKNWSRTGLQNEIVNALLINPQNPKVMYAGCGYSGYAEVPVYKSTDGGETWTASFKGIPGYVPPVMGVWGNLPTDVFAVERDGTTLHYDGSTWSEMSSGSEWLCAIWGSSPTDVFAVGPYGTIVHYDGNTWTEIDSGTTERLWGVWGNSPTDVFAVGDNGTVLHYDGNSWATMNSETTEWLLAVWGSSPADVFAVGDNGTVLHYDGNTWIEMDSRTTERLWGVWGSSPTDVFAVGDNGTVLHYDGNTWATMNSGTTEWLLAVWGNSPTDVFAVGGSGVILHYDGSIWSETDLGTKEGYVSVWGTSGTDVFVGGNRGSILHYDGNAWSPTRPGGSWRSAVTDLEFHRQDSNVVYAGTYGAGVYVSPNQAGDWLNLGTPEYDVFAISTSSLYTATQGGLLQCTGTGVIAGKVTDALTQAGIHGATVFNDFGINTISVNGEYIMVSPCGIWALTAIADGYANKTVWDVTVYGGDINWTDLSMERGLSDKPPIFDGGNGGNGGGSDYECFIATAAYGSGMAEQVQMLRAFRDAYLMPHAAGRKLVNLYYATGKPIAVYIESHPWLKAPVRIILYPLVGLAWLLLSTTAFAKGVIVVCLLIGCVGVIRFR